MIFTISTILNSAVVIAAVIAVVTFNQKLKEDIRKSKEEHYFDFFKNFTYATYAEGKNEEADKAHAEFSCTYNRILLIGSSVVVKNMKEFWGKIQEERKIDNDLLTELVKSMRIDLYEGDKKFNLFFFELRFKALHNKNINKDYPTVNLVGKDHSLKANN